MRSGGRSCGLWRLGDGGSGADVAGPIAARVLDAVVNGYH